METQLAHNTKRINLGAWNSSFSLSTIRKAYYFLAGSFFLMAVFYIFRNSVGLFERTGMSVLYLVTASMFFCVAHIELSTTSKYAAHVIISKNGLKIKTGVFKNSHFFNWEEIKEIQVGSYQIGIKSKKDIQYFSYQTRKEASIELKNTIMEIAAQKRIAIDIY